MRIFRHLFRRLVVGPATAVWAAGVIFATLCTFSGGVVPCTVLASELERGGPEITGLRLGRHQTYLRSVFDLTGRPNYDARATTARGFEVSMPGVSLPPDGHTALAADPLAPDLFVRPLVTDGGPLCFEITSRTEAYIRRAFVIDPTVGGGGAAGGVWRLVLDIVPRPSGASAAGQAQPPVRALAALPPLHGMETPDPSRALEDREPLSDDARGGAAVAASPPEVVEVSWARASRILRELQDRQSRDADAPLPPQLVLPEKYRQSTVPLR